MTKRSLLAVVLLILLLLSASGLAQSSPKTVHVTLNPTQQSGILPTSMALFSYTNNEGILVWEAGVPAVPPIRNGRVFIDQRGETRTAIAFTSGFTPATLSIELHNQDGGKIGSLTRPLRAQENIALFADELFENLPADFVGSLTFSVTSDSASGVGALTLRGGLNTKGEPVFATLKVADLDQPPDSTEQVLPQVGGAPGFSTQIVLINPSDQPITGKIRLLNSSGPFELELAGQLLSELPFSLPGRGVERFDLGRSAGLGVGYAAISVESGSSAPVSSAIFQYRDSQQSAPAKNLLSEAGVLANPPTTGALLYVDTRTSRSGVAISNHMNDGVSLDLTLVKADGSEEKVTRSIEASGHLAVFVDELFPGLDAQDVILKLSSPVPIYLTPLKLTVNQREHPILATLPYLDTERTELGIHLLPQVAFGAGLKTEMIHLIPPSIGSSPQQNGPQELCWYLDFLNPETGYSLVNLQQSLSAGFRVCSPPGSGLLLEPVAPGIGVPLAGESGPLIEIEPELFPATHGCCDTSHQGLISIVDDCPGGCDDSVSEGDAGLHTGSGVGVYLHSGELYLTEKDLEIPGRGFNWKFERKYRSGGFAEGPLGHNWEFNYNRRLAVVGDQVFSYFITLAEPGDVIRMDGLTRADVYKIQPDGSFRSPTGFFTRLWRQPDGTFVERDSRGIRTLYGSPDAKGIARMISISDPDGNTMQFRHDNAGRLVEVIDTFGRSIRYRYSPAGQLKEVNDFAGRTLSFAYGPNGDLIGVTKPAVTGTPNGNDFPQGKTTRYTYSSQEELAHNLVSITAPNEVVTGGPARVLIDYDSEDRVTALTLGGTNSSGVPAGGTIQYEYRNPTDPSAVARTDVTDRNGNLTQYSFNALGNVILKREFTNRNLRPGDPARYETRFEYNADGNRTREIFPLGNSIEYAYDEQNPDRLQRGNLLSFTSRPDSTRWGDQQFIRETFSYEPIYNQIRTRTESRGHDPDHVPQNGGANSPERYSVVHTFDYQEGNNAAAIAESIGLNSTQVSQLLNQAGMQLSLGDLNGDGDTSQIGGQVIRSDYPSVHLLPDSILAQQIEQETTQLIFETAVYNRFGQITESVAPEGNVTRFEYFPENDPDGNGKDFVSERSSGPFGYLKGVIVDARNTGSESTPEAAQIQNLYFYDDVGNVVRQVDGRGISTLFKRNRLNQIVQIERASGQGLFAANPVEPEPLQSFRFLERFFYDHNDNIILTQVEDRGNTSGVDGAPSASDLPQTAQNPDPPGGTAFVDQVTKYDILDNPVAVSNEAGSPNRGLLTHRFRYDPNENRVLTIQPEGNAITSVFDERDLLYEETAGSSFPPDLVHLATDDPLNYIVRGGAPSASYLIYDANRNLVELVDAADTDGSEENNSDITGGGDRLRFIYDGFDRLVSTIDPVGNQIVTQYDAASNIVRQLAFGSTGGPSPTRDGPDLLPVPVSKVGQIQSGNLVSANLLSATESSYDEMGRPFQTDRLLFLNTIDLNRPPDVSDGAADIGKGDLTPDDSQAIPGLSGVDLIGRVSSRSEFDRNSRVLFQHEDDGDTYRFSYDGGNRLISAEDPEGNRVEFAYDDNGNTIETRQIEVSQVQGISNESFLTTYFYDSLDRLSKQVNNLGHTHYFRYDSRDNIVASADARAPLGENIGRRAFPNGAQTVNRTNDFGNVRRYYYDGVGRTIRQEIVLTASGEGDGVHIGANESGNKTAPPAPDPTQGGGDGYITTWYGWNKNNLLSSFTDDNGNQTQFSYDDLNRLLTQTEGSCPGPALADRCDPPTTVFYSYDLDHNVTQVIDENGSITLCSYDALNRKKGCQIIRAPGVQGSSRTELQYDGLSRVVWTSEDNNPSDPNDDVDTTHAFDSLNRIIEETQQIGASASQVVSSSWRAENLRSSLTYPNNRAIGVRFDLLDRTSVITDQQTGGTIATNTYIGPARLLERRYPHNGARMSFLDPASPQVTGYDGLGRPLHLNHFTADDQLLFGFEYSFDRESNPVEETKRHNPANSEKYQYDSAHRLRRFDRPDPTGQSPIHSAWALDGVGNWVQVDEEDRQHSSFNELIQRSGSTSDSYFYDANGNLIDDGQFLLAWDSQNRLHGVTRKSDGARIATYTYDLFNRRLQKTVEHSGELNGVSRFFYDDWSVLEEQDSGGITEQQFVFGDFIDEPLVMDRNLNADQSAAGDSDARVFFHHNLFGSIHGLTNNSAIPTSEYLYEAYGFPTVTAGQTDDNTLANPFTFGARRSDRETGFFYHRNRYYSADQGRFLSRDPIWDQANHGNQYAFVGNSPTTSLDPMGTNPVKWLLRKIGIGQKPPKRPSWWNKPGGFNQSGKSALSAPKGGEKAPAMSFSQSAMPITVMTKETVKGYLFGKVLGAGFKVLGKVGKPILEKFLGEGGKAALGRSGSLADDAFEAWSRNLSKVPLPKDAVVAKAASELMGRYGGRILYQHPKLIIMEGARGAIRIVAHGNPYASAGLSPHAMAAGISRLGLNPTSITLYSCRTGLGTFGWKLAKASGVPVKAPLGIVSVLFQGLRRGTAQVKVGEKWVTGSQGWTRFSPPPN